MDLYQKVSEDVSRGITKSYSTSFGMASSLFDQSIRQDIYNIYGFVRIADEVVDTYDGKDCLEVLDLLEKQTYQDLARGYSTNPVIQAFVFTCQKYGIKKDLIAPFMASMRMDTGNVKYTPDLYEEYIYGSAEVVGLMCLKVFCSGNKTEYEELKEGARALGSAFQKVNFLRDLKEDNEKLGRYYFPVGSYDKFDEATKQTIIDDITSDFEMAKVAIDKLPASARKAVNASYVYFSRLLEILQHTPALELKERRVRLSDFQKIQLLLRIKLGLL